MRYQCRWWGPGLLAAACLLWPLHGLAYVMQGARLLELMVDRLGRQTRGLGVEQTLLIPGTGMDTPPVTLNQTVTYRYPNRFRAEIRSPVRNHLHVYAYGESITIDNGKIMPPSASGFDHYMDPLLFRTRRLLQQHLGQLGIDAQLSSVGRLEGSPVYVLGAQYPDLRVSQLWLDKLTFQPVRLWLVAQGAGSGNVDIRFERWRAFGDLWYPERIVFYQNGLIGRQIETRNVTAAPALDDHLFDIARLRSRLSTSTANDPGQPADQTRGEIQETIDNFKNLYD